MAKAVKAATTAELKEKLTAAVSARVGEDGVVRVVYSIPTSSGSGDSQQEEQVWASSAKCASLEGAGKVALTIDGATGQPVVKCPDGVTLPLATNA
jgi:hypothetical protein